MIKMLEKIFGTYSSREIKGVVPIADKVIALEQEYSKLTEEELKGKTEEFKKRIQNGESLDDILVEAFATVREASYRVLGMKHFKVQVIGGIVLHQGRIAEMKTGEGKTLVATLPVYLNALSGKGVHIITVNDYLAKRDSEWMGKIYKYLGLSVGLVIHGMDLKQKKEAYNCDITYGTNNEYGFDYLRDNMVTYKDQMVQRDLNYAIVDEVDSILIDEARTPLIISGPAEKSTDLYKQADTFVRKLKSKVIVESDDKVLDDGNGTDEDYDYIVDLKAHSASLVSRGTKKAEGFFNIENLSDIENSTLAHHINQALKAHGIMKNEKDYVIKDGEVIIVDEFTGRLMFGRRYNEGLHQAIEAKEGVKIQNESKTLATITFQNYFRMYKKLAGMTGTAMTEEQEFQQIYKLDVIEIPTNKPMIRKDKNDVIYRTEKAKLNSIVSEIEQSHKKGQPILVGTITIEKSEVLSGMLKRCGVKHEVLNAKYHEKEAEIIAQAGKFGAVTIATNMAGRGTDIMLGGNAEYLAKQEMRKQGYEEDMIGHSTSFVETTDELIIEARNKFKEIYDRYKKEIDIERDKVVEAGGLKVIGTERHESRRIDNQLRGRSGRQGDPGESVFFISLEDDLMKLFGGGKILNFANKIGAEEIDEEPMDHGILSAAIENAQKNVEGRNLSIRKNVLEYDDVMNLQRETIYGERKRVLYGESMKDKVQNMVKRVAENLVEIYTGEQRHIEEWDMESLTSRVEEVFEIKGFIIPREEWEETEKEDVKEKLENLVSDKYSEREKEFGEDIYRELERVVMLQVVDAKWMDHIDAMDQLRQGIGIRAYGQKNPIVEYKFEGHTMFEEMIHSIQEDVVKLLFHMRKERLPQFSNKDINVLRESRGDDEAPAKPQTVKKENTVGRNDPCPCGSGKKYKKCCGTND